MGNCLKYIMKFIHPFSATHRISGKILREVKHIAQGGYGYVSLVEDTETGKNYAMKKMICQTQQQKHMYNHQVKIMKQLTNCPHIIGYFGSHQIQRDGFLQTYIVMEFCQKTAYDLLLQTEKKGGIKLSERQILKILKQTAQGLQQMHSLGVYHHDVKVQNILLSKEGIAKLCDFGSSTKQKIDLATIPKSKNYQYEQKFQKNTTLMYRPPQMIDVYLKYPVDQRVDIWMLGCVLFVLNYRYHPFQQQGKLSIVNAVIKYPQTVSPKMQKLMRNILTPNPYYRPKLQQIIKIIDEWETNDFKLNSIAQKIYKNQKHLQRQQFDKIQKYEWHKMRPENQWRQYQ